MGHAGVGAGYHNGIKGQTVCAVFVQAINEFCAKLLLCHAHPDPGQDLRKGLVRNLLGLLHKTQFAGLLLRAEGIDGLLAGLQGGSQLLLIGPELLHRQIALLKAQGLDAKVRAGLVDAGGIGMLPVYGQDFKAHQILLRRLDVTAVRKIPAASPGYQSHPFGDIKLRRIMTAVAAGEE